MEERFSNREIREKWDDIASALSRIELQVIYTNGKVRKLIIALVLIAGVVIGQNFANMKEIIGLIAGIIK